MATSRRYKLNSSAESQSGAFGPYKFTYVPVEEGDTIATSLAVPVGEFPRTGPHIKLTEFVVLHKGIRILACPFCGSICAGARPVGTSCSGELRVQGPHDRDRPHFCEAHRTREGRAGDAAATILVLEKAPATV